MTRQTNEIQAAHTTKVGFPGIRTFLFGTMHRTRITGVAGCLNKGQHARKMFLAAQFKNV